MRSEPTIGFLLQRDPQKNDVRPEDLYWVGTAGNVVRYITGAEGAHHLVVQGEQRFRVLEFLAGWPFLVARVALIVETSGELTPEIEARFLQLKEQAAEAIGLLPQRARRARARWCRASPRPRCSPTWWPTCST